MVCVYVDVDVYVYAYVYVYVYIYLCMPLCNMKVKAYVAILGVFGLEGSEEGHP